MKPSARRLRVLHVIPTLTGGGAEAFLCALAPNLDERIFDVAIMSVYPTDVPLPPDARERIPIITIQRTGRYDPGFFGRMVAEMRAFQPDIVHTHLHNGKYWGRLAAMLARVPVILFTEHNPCGENRMLPEIVVDVAVNQFTDGIITFVEQQRALLARAERLPLDKVVVIENGIALPPLPTAERRMQARRALGAHDDELAVLVVARLIGRKNQRLAIAAVQQVSPAMRNRVRVYIIGGGEDDAMLRECAREYGVADRITFTGNRSDAVELLYGGDVFYMPSLAEGMPLAMLEAMSVGLPVISVPWVGVTELLRDGELGTILPNWEPRTTAAAFERALQSPEILRERATMACTVVRERHDIRRVARLHEAFYAEVARARGLRVPSPGAMPAVAQ